MDETHMKITTVSLDNKTRNTINASSGMPGNRGRYDCWQPWWSNHPLYLTLMYPLTCENCGETVPVFGEFCIGKYNAAYSSIQWLCVTDTTDKKYREGFGDAWFENGEHFGGTGVVPAEMSAPRLGRSDLAVNLCAGGYRLDISAAGAYRISLAMPSGRVCRTLQGTGQSRYVLADKDLPRGMWFAVMQTGSGTAGRNFVVR
jgi:hypothetical protein